MMSGSFVMLFLWQNNLSYPNDEGPTTVVEITVQNKYNDKSKICFNGSIPRLIVDDTSKFTTTKVATTDSLSCGLLKYTNLSGDLV